MILFRFLLIGIILDDCVVKIKCYCYFLLSSRNLVFSNSPNSEIQFFSSLKVWNVVAGNKLYTFEEHKPPVYSECHHNKENLHVCSCFICTFASWPFFFNFSWETSKACFSCLSQSFRLRPLLTVKQLHLNIMVHLFYNTAMLAEGGRGLMN